VSRGVTTKVPRSVAGRARVIPWFVVASGVDIDDSGEGVVSEPRMYRVRAYVFTFG